jgi:hypothetical protein
MALNFPDPATQTPVNTWSPTSTPSASTNGLTYLWDGEKWTTEGGVPNLHWTRTGSVLSPTNADDDVQIASLNSGPLAGCRNALINGSFAVAQRSVDETPSGPNVVGYLTVDRWAHTGSGDNVGRIVRDRASSSIGAPPGFDYTLHFVDSSKTSRSGFVQTIELPLAGQPGHFIPGSQWTLSFWVNIDASSRNVESLTFCDDFNGTNTVTCSAGGGLSYTEIDTAANNWRRYSVTYTINNNAPAATNAALRVNLGTVTQSGQLAITGVQLEPGPVATPFEQRPIGLDLSLCERYYIDRRLRSQDSALAGFDLFVYPTTMRALPTVAASSGISVGTVLSGSVTFSHNSNQNFNLTCDAEL